MYGITINSSPAQESLGSTLYSNYRSDTHLKHLNLPTLPPGVSEAGEGARWAPARIFHECWTWGSSADLEENCFCTSNDREILPAPGTARWFQLQAECQRSWNRTWLISCSLDFLLTSACGLSKPDPVKLSIFSGTTILVDNYNSTGIADMFKRPESVWPTWIKKTQTI